MNLEKAEKLNRKADVIIREIFLILASIIIFPFKSIRILAFKWHLWIQKWESEIRKDHEDFFNNYN